MSIANDQIRALIDRLNTVDAEHRQLEKYCAELQTKVTSSLLKAFILLELKTLVVVIDAHVYLMRDKVSYLTLNTTRWHINQVGPSHVFPPPSWQGGLQEPLANTVRLCL